MRSKRQLEQLAKQVLLSCKTNENINLEKVNVVLSLLKERRMQEIHLSLSSTEVLPFLRYFIQLLNTKIIEETVAVYTPNTLADREKELLQGIITRDNKQFTTYDVEPSLIGGFRIQSGWHVIDNSIATKLHILE